MSSTPRSIPLAVVSDGASSHEHASLEPGARQVAEQKIGRSPVEYLIHTRINAAKFYLKTTQLSLKEISYRCGFSSESSFCTVFKRVAGVTPQTYRNAGGV